MIASLPLTNIELGNIYHFPTNIFMSQVTKVDEKIIDGVVLYDVLAHYNSRGEPEEKMYYAVHADQIVSKRPYRTFSYSFYTDGIVRNIVDENKPLYKQSRYGVFTGCFDGNGAKSNIDKPFFIQDVEHLSALINASVSTNVELEKEKPNFDRLEILWLYVLSRANLKKNVTAILKKYEKKSGLFPSSFLLSELGFDGIVRNFIDFELLPLGVKFANFGTDVEYAKFEY